jgi:hypothetical protein
MIGALKNVARLSDSSDMCYKNSILFPLRVFVVGDHLPLCFYGPPIVKSLWETNKYVKSTKT